MKDKWNRNITNTLRGVAIILVIIQHLGGAKIWFHLSYSMWWYWRCNLSDSFWLWSK